MAERPTTDPGSLLSAVTAEHSALQATRTASVTESVGRTTIYLGSLSATLVALALIAQGESTAGDTRLLAAIVLPALIVLGVVTFVRVIETGIEDTIAALAINRIRHHYRELAGDDATRYFLLGAHDDVDGVLANIGARQSPWRPLLSVASVIALINSMVAGTLAGVTADAVASRSVAVALGLVVAAVGVVLHRQLGLRRYVVALERFTPAFPTP